MLISIVANKPLQTYYLEDLRDKRIDFTLDTEFELAYGWYKLVVEYPGSKLKISDIVINTESLDRLLYTGWFREQDSDVKHSPGTTLYKPGQFELYIHSNMGVMWQTLYESIVGRDFGNDLFENYMHTVDKPVELSDEYPAQIRGFFAHSNGPRWWKKNTIVTPYETLQPEVLADIDRQKLHQEMKTMCDFVPDFKNVAFPKRGRELLGGRVNLRNSPYLPYTELDELPGEEIKRLCNKIGIKRLLAVTLQTQYPGEAFAPHVDVHYEQETKHNLQGPCSFVLDLSEDTTGHYFKVSQGGLIPLEHGTFFNFNYCHATYNDSEVVRPLAIIFGERDRELNWYLNN